MHGLKKSEHFTLVTLRTLCLPVIDSQPLELKPPNSKARYVPVR
jgi:hypothetical protein